MSVEYCLLVRNTGLKGPPPLKMVMGVPETVCSSRQRASNTWTWGFIDTVVDRDV